MPPAPPNIFFATGALQELLLSQDKLYTLHFRIGAEVIGELFATCG